MSSIAFFGRSSSECGDQLFSSMLDKMGTIIDSVHTANPHAEVVGMGYEMIFGGAGCRLVPATIFHQCWKGEADENAILCFNEQIVRMQAVWDELASECDYVTVLNTLDLTQIFDGDEIAKVGAPNMEKMRAWLERSDSRLRSEAKQKYTKSLQEIPLACRFSLHATPSQDRSLNSVPGGRGQSMRDASTPGLPVCPRVLVRILPQ